jgi:starch synthase (maltosyl-transferring)
MAERGVKAGSPGGDGRIRAIIDSLSPTVDGGRFPAKRIAGEPVRIEAHCFADGHDKLRVTMRWRELEGPARDGHVGAGQ